MQHPEPSRPAATLSDRVRRFLAAPHTAALATVGADGAPHQTFIWYGLEPDGTILVNSLVGRRWPAELQRDGRAALAIANVQNQLSWVGLATEVASIDEDRERALADIIALAYRYQGQPTEAYLDEFRRQQRITFRMRITGIHDHLREPDL
jgi:PPOX class probable F420-dependent enzyme